MSSSTSGSTLRQPSEAHKGRNGFRDSYEPADIEHPDDIAIRNHRYAQWVLKHKGTPVPRKETLRELGMKKPFLAENLENIDEKIKELKRQHARDLDSLFTFQADELRQVMLDHRRCIDDSAYMNIDENYPDQVEFRDALRDLEIRMRECPHHTRAMEDALSTLRYTYLKALIPLLRRRRVLRDHEHDYRKRRDATFPRTIEDYRKISDREVQLRVARFLTADNSEQERMMDKFGWAYRGVDPLRAAYKTNAEFKAEMQDMLKDVQASDPRKRPSLNYPSTRNPILPYATFSPVS
ncbi:hypothetical protein V8B97DRAFT_2021158 [Scleroderma yunnanense]